MKRLLTLFLVFCTLFALTACGEKAPQGGGDERQAIVLINGFEDISEMDTLTNYGVLGKVSLNKDAAYVKSGEGSAKVVVTSNPYKVASPYLLQNFNLMKREENYTDFSDVAFVTMQVFNPSSETKRVGVQLAYTYTNGIREYFDLAPNAWTLVKLNVIREYIPKLDTMNDMLFVGGLRITFDRPQEDATFYLDDLYLYKTESEYTDVVMSLKKHEICSFDEGWQVALSVLEKGTFDLLMPTVSQESEITSTGSGSSIKIIAPAGVADYQTTLRWPGVALNEEMLKLFDWGSYPDTARLCFDVYAPLENGVDEVWLSAYTDGRRYYSGPPEKVIPGKWTTISYTVGEMNATYEYTEEHNFAHTTYLVVRWGEHPGADRTLYMDNFRMEMA